MVLGKHSGSAATPAWPDLLFPLCFSALVSPISAAFPFLGSCAHTGQEQSPRGAWVGKGFCRADRGGSSPFAVTLLFLLPSPGQWFSCRGCSRWRGCPGTGGTAINSLCPRSSVPRRERLLLALLVQPCTVSMENLAFGVRVVLWPQRGWRRASTRGYLSSQIQTGETPAQLLGTAFPKGDFF